MKKKTSKIITKEKAKKSIKNTGSYIAKNKKELLYVGGAVLISIVVYKLYKNVTNGVDSFFDDKIDTVDVNVKINASKTTISKEQAQQFAKTILDACDVMEPLYGTDEEAIKAVFLKLKNGDDFKMVYEAFDLKNYNGNGSPPVGIFRHIDNYAPRDLVYWLRSELSASDGDVYIIVKNRIESAGYSF